MIVPDFDESKFALGSLCKRKHAWRRTAQSLRRIATSGSQKGRAVSCEECRRLRKRSPEVRKGRQERKRVRRVCDAEFREKLRKEEQKRYRKNKNKPAFRKRRREHERERRLKDPEYHTVCRLRRRLHDAFHSQKMRKTLSAKEYGIDWQAIVDHLGSPPSPDHEIDHIQPCASFDFSDPAQIRACWHPSNLRWLHRNLNAAKSNMSEEEFQEKLHERPDLLVLWETPVGREITEEARTP